MPLSPLKVMHSSKPNRAELEASFLTDLPVFPEEDKVASFQSSQSSGDWEFSVSVVIFIFRSSQPHAL